MSSPSSPDDQGQEQRPTSYTRDYLTVAHTSLEGVMNALDAAKDRGRPATVEDLLKVAHVNAMCAIGAAIADLVDMAREDMDK